MLRPIIENILKLSPAKNIEDVLQAFYKLDEEWASKILKQQCLTVPKVKESHISASLLKDAKGGVAQMDATGEDYDMEETRFKYPKQDSAQEVI